MFTIVVSLAACSSSSNANTSKGTEGLSYTSFGDGLSVNGYTGKDDNVIIPDTYNDLPVYSIDAEAFDNSEIKTVTLGENLNHVSMDAFGDCIYLTTVNITSDKIDFALGAFSGCVSLENINIPANATINMDYDVFLNCSRLTSLDFSSASTESSFDVDSFRNSGLKSIKLKYGMTVSGMSRLSGITSDNWDYFIINAVDGNVYIDWIGASSTDNPQSNASIAENYSSEII